MGFLLLLLFTFLNRQILTNKLSTTTQLKWSNLPKNATPPSLELCLLWIRGKVLVVSLLNSIRAPFTFSVPLVPEKRRVLYSGFSLSLANFEFLRYSFASISLSSISQFLLYVRRNKKELGSLKY